MGSFLASHNPLALYHKTKRYLTILLDQVLKIKISCLIYNLENTKGKNHETSLFTITKMLLNPKWKDDIFSFHYFFKKLLNMHHCIRKFKRLTPCSQKQDLNADSKYLWMNKSEGKKLVCKSIYSLFTKQKSVLRQKKEA